MTKITLKYVKYTKAYLAASNLLHYIAVIAITYPISWFSNRDYPTSIIAEHAIITFLVIVIAHYLGDLIYEFFGT